LKIHLLFVIIIVLFAAVSCVGGKSPESLTFMAGYKPQANFPFVAVYVAKELGYFRDQDIEVEILHSGGGGENISLLLAGKVDFTTADVNSIFKLRSHQEVPIVALALFGQRGQQAFMSLTNSGIVTPSDWEGKRFGYKISVPPDYLAILESNNVQRGDIDEVQVGFDPRILIEGKVDVLAVFKSNEPNIVNNMGFNVNLIEAADYDLATLGLTYVSTESTVKNNFDNAERFLKATLKASQFAIDNPEEALDIVMKYADKEDRDHMRFMLLTEIRDASSAITEEKGFGWMDPDQWQLVHDGLIRFGAIESRVAVSEVMTNQFLESIYNRGILEWP